MKKIFLAAFIMAVITVIHFTAAKISALPEKNQVHLYVNLWKNTLYLKEGEYIIEQYPISPGKEDSPTPIGEFKIIEKSSGWGGGFGSRWIGLNVPWGNYGIHGTNKPWLIGKRVSSGCIRMKNKDVENLFEKVTIGTPVKITGPIQFRNLSKGSKGYLVVLIQQRLRGEGYFEGEINGIYGSQTELGVKRFQQDHHLPQTGGITAREFRLLGLIE